MTPPGARPPTRRPPDGQARTHRSCRKCRARRCGPPDGDALPGLLLRHPKVPGLDHAAQLRDLRAVVGESAQVRVVDCLDACEYANVIVVQPSADGRRAGGRPLWLGMVNDPDATAEVAAFVHEGGPGLAEPPDVLDLYAFQPSRRVRQGVEEA